MDNDELMKKLTDAMELSKEIGCMNHTLLELAIINIMSRTIIISIIGFIIYSIIENITMLSMNYFFIIILIFIFSIKDIHLLYSCILYIICHRHGEKYFKNIKRLLELNAEVDQNLIDTLNTINERDISIKRSLIKILHQY